MKRTGTDCSKWLCLLFLVFGICFLQPKFVYAKFLAVDLTNDTKSNTYEVVPADREFVKNWVAQIWKDKMNGIEKVNITSLGGFDYIDVDKDGHFDFQIQNQTYGSIKLTATGVGNMEYNVIGVQFVENSAGDELWITFPKWCYNSAYKRLFIKSDEVMKKSGEPFTTIYDQPWKDKRFEIEEVIIGEGVTVIGSYALADFEKMEKITLPHTLKEISISSMYYCYELKELDIPESVEIIGSSALHGCKKLELITIRNPGVIIGSDKPPYPTFPYDSSKSLKIKGHNGSQVESYCKHYSVSFESLCTPGAAKKEAEKAATCTDKGSYEEVKYCTHPQCGAEVSRVKIDIPALGHVPEEVITKAKPNADGKIESICKTCKAVVSTKKIAAPVSFVPEKSEYTAAGAEIKPAVTVKDSDGAVIAPENYKLVYSNNIHPGKAAVTVDFSGSEKYSGTGTTNFEIKYISLENAEILIPDQEWTGEPIDPVNPVVKVDGKTLVKGTDYTLTSIAGSNTAVGTAVVIAAGTGLYGGTKTGSFKIVPKSLEKAVVQVPDQQWTGKELTPAPKVTLDGVALKADEDYTVIYSANKDKGTATVTVTGKGNYKDLVTGTFRIVAGEPVISPSNPAVLEDVEKPLISSKDEEGGKGTSFYLLQAKGEPLSKKSIKITWTKVKGATGYIIYGNRCGKNKKYLKLKTLSASQTSWTRSLKKGTYYKVIVAAVKGDMVLAKSKTVHVATNGGKVGNPTGISLSKKKLSLKVGKTKTIKATVKAQGKPVKTHRKVAWESSNPSVATVNSAGVIQAVAKGKCYVYAYAQNGLFARVKVTVKN